MVSDETPTTLADVERELKNREYELKLLAKAEQRQHPDYVHQALIRVQEAILHVQQAQKPTEE